MFQTSIHDFYKSTDLKRQQKKLQTVKTAEKVDPTEKRHGVILKRKKSKKKESIPSTLSKTANNSSTQVDPNNKAKLMKLIDSDDDSEMIEMIQTNYAQKTETLKFESELSHEATLDDVLLSIPLHKTRNRACSESASGANVTPKKRLQKSPATSAVKRLKSRSPKKGIYIEGIDSGKVSDMIDNLNLTRLGILPKNDFNLEIIYSGNEIEGPIITYNMDEISLVYDIDKVNIPREKHAEHLFNIIANVFSDYLNCGYFNDQELDQIFDLLTLTKEAQMLFVRMIKRKYIWRKSSTIKYPEISIDLKPYMDELEEKKFLTSNIANESLETLLAMLSADEIHEVCKKSKIPKQSNKALAVKKILKTSTIKSLFAGMESPAVILRKMVLNILEHCVCLPEEIINLIDRIVTLFVPSDNVTTQLADVFLNLTLIREGTLRYPEVPVRRYPVFRNRDHLVRYVEWRNKWRQAMELTKGNPDNWEILKTLGREAHICFMSLLKQDSTRQKDVIIPKHVLSFSEEYVCIKIVTVCLEVFKKEESLIPEAIKMLRNLINQKVWLQSRKGEWYEELALIEMTHRKNLEAAASVVIEGLNFADITETGKHDLTKRAVALLKRKSGLNSDTKLQLKSLIEEQRPEKISKVFIIANMMQGNQPGRKSTCFLDMGDGDKGFMGVEQRALFHYRNMGYIRGWHCEGSLPVTLFTLLMWEELYSISVPAAYLCSYQKAPLDLFTSDFYNNRKKYIDQKMEDIRTLSANELGAMIETSFEMRQHYESLLPTKLPIGSEELKNIVQCMGTAVVIGICKKLISNFSTWRSGFPDLIVWNPMEVKCKIVEVKGPGDTLSLKQKLWLQYLEEIGADAEVCGVKTATKN